MGKTKTTEEFIRDAKFIHGDKYDYIISKYIGAHLRLEIICKVHGTFSQTAHSHTSGNGCPYCAGREKTTSDFILAARQIHGDRYEYPNSHYTSAKTKLVITCKEHGDFMQRPDRHIIGAGCPKCGGRSVNNTSEFITKASSIHNSRYTYEYAVYTRAKNKVKITCKEHGVFEQMADYHLSGHGCPRCAEHGFNINKRATFYIYTFGDYVGFGITNNFKRRNKTHLQNIKNFGLDATLIATYNMSGESALQLESHIKRTFEIKNSGIIGFKTEAMCISQLHNLIYNISKRGNLMDEMDHIQNFNDQHNQDAIDEHRRLMVGMEMVEGEYACDDCGKILHSLTKVRANAPVILCGECADWHKQRNKLGKMRDGYL